MFLLFFFFFPPLLFGCVQKLCGFGSVIIIKFLLLFFLFFSPATSCKTLYFVKMRQKFCLFFFFNKTILRAVLFCSALLCCCCCFYPIFNPPPPIGRRCLSSPQKKKTMTAWLLCTQRVQLLSFFFSSLKKNLEPFHTTNVSNCVSLCLTAVESSAKRMMETDVVFLFVELGSWALAALSNGVRRAYKNK